MVKLKANVRPRSLVILAAVANVASTLPFAVWVTSGEDSVHTTTSLHSTGNALDVRSKNFPSSSSKRTFLRQVLRRLGPSYQGLLEGEHTPNEHFHFEYDPP